MSFRSTERQTPYTARLLLLSLEKDGKVLYSHRSIQNSLRWYPVYEKSDDE